jgi:hypothetical protein
MHRQCLAIAVGLGFFMATLPLNAAITRGPVAKEESQAAPPPAAVPVKPADVAGFLGTWEIPLDTPRGPLVATLTIRAEAGKVVAGLSSAQLPEERITDITKSGDVVTLKKSKDYHGPLSSYQGLVIMVLTLTPKGKDLGAFFDFNYSTVQLPGTATKKK